MSSNQDQKQQGERVSTNNEFDQSFTTNNKKKKKHLMEALRVNVTKHLQRHFEQCMIMPLQYHKFAADGEYTERGQKKKIQTFYQVFSR